VVSTRIPANSDALKVPSFRRWRFEMKLSPLVETALADLFRYISGMESTMDHDALAWATIRAAGLPCRANPECVLTVLSETSSELMLQLLPTMPSESRFLALRQTLFRAMEKIGFFGVQQGRE
jgi:hypothetical protein